MYLKTITQKLAQLLEKLKISNPTVYTAVQVTLVIFFLLTLTYDFSGKIFVQIIIPIITALISSGTFDFLPDTHPKKIEVAAAIENEVQKRLNEGVKLGAKAGFSSSSTNAFIGLHAGRKKRKPTTKKKP